MEGAFRGALPKGARRWDEGETQAKSMKTFS